MTTNLNGIAGPSRRSPSPKADGLSPSSETGLKDGDSSAAKLDSMRVDENGEVIKVPAFLNKLFSMVSDAGTDELIHWAESGDSILVPNHERFGKELLPRFFKHSNFSSFVRQLNMYGFHKVPHLQSGVLKNETPLELWEFINPFFKREQPQLLNRVTRKNNRPGVLTQPIPPGTGGTRSSARQAGMISPGGQYHPVHLITDGSTEGEALPLVGPSGQMFDISAITSGIAAIRQTQASIGADLKALQTSNEHLWREALESRERNQKHQETIDLIVSFLERLFGTEGEGLKGLKEALRRGGLARTREDEVAEEGGVSKKRRRLGLDRMIEDGRTGSGDDSDGQIVELANGSSTAALPFSLPRLARARSRQTPASAPSSGTDDPWTSASQRFTTLPTEDEISPYNAPTASTASSKTGFTPGDQALPDQPPPPALYGLLNPSNNNALAQNNHTNGAQVPPLSPNSTANAAAAFNLDPALLQTTIGSLLQSPAAAQMFLNSLSNSAQGQALQTPSQALQSPTRRTPAAPHQPFPTTASGQQPQPQPQPQSNDKDDYDPTLALFSPLPNQGGLMQNSDDLLKSYQANGMSTDVDKLQQDIDSLVRSMGLDFPANGEQGGDGEFDVDEFLNHLAKAGSEE